MKADEYKRMACVEETHWWYCGLREAILQAVRHFCLPSQSAEYILDAGCGTGENLRALQRELPSLKYAGGFDVSPLALGFAAEKCPAADLYLSDICAPKLHVVPLDLVLSCDVLSVPGLTKALPGLRTLIAGLRPGGLFVLNLPAYSWLRSHHDAAVGQHHRFCARIVHSLMRSLHLHVELLTYRVWSLFPAIVLYRLPSLLGRGKDQGGPSDLFVPHPLWNATLGNILRWENWATAHGIRFPWGSSIFVVARKPI